MYSTVKDVCVQVVSFQEGNGCLHYPGTLRNTAVLKYLLRKYKELCISIDLESQLVCTLHTCTYDILTTFSYYSTVGALLFQLLASV